MTNKVVLRKKDGWWFIDEEDKPTSTIFCSASLEKVLEFAKDYCGFTGALLWQSPLPFVFDNFTPLHDK